MPEDDSMSLENCQLRGNRDAAHSTETFTLRDGQRGHN